MVSENRKGFINLFMFTRNHGHNPAMYWKTQRKIRRAEVTKFDVKIENDEPVLFRAEMKISFEIERKNRLVNICIT
ncbi:MAG TPA: hypothetical protein ENI45_04860 [Thermoplasmatales archaeon]|nr:hypothetical protein [Thermoplasmatales archaeon]